MIDRWFSIFHNDPQKAVNDLFSGRAGLGSSMRLDIPEILYQEFPAVPELQDARQKLDAALFAWFAAMRKEYARQISRLGFGVYSKRLCDCLVSVQLLDLPMFPYQLKQGLDSWLRWLTPLRLAPERDPALECWRLLGRQQEDRSFVPAWLRLAADGRPEYLDVALFGLQGCPGENQVLMLVALLLHKSARYRTGAEAYAHFKRRYAALRGLYPRSQKYWQETLKEALLNFNNFSQNFEENSSRKNTANELYDIVFSFLRKKSISSKRRIVFPISKSEHKNLIFEIKNSSHDKIDILSERFFLNQKKNLRYAEQTGNSYFFIRTLCSQGGLLLKKFLLFLVQWIDLAR